MAKVLLVEDDNNLREIYQARLQAEGYEISSAQDGEQALVVAKDFKPDLIISDVMMPKISGFEMLDILRNTAGLEHTRVIMLTALSQAEDQSRADSLGADRYLVKSQVTLEDIIKAAHDILDGNEAAAADPAASAPETASAASSVEESSAETSSVAPAVEEMTVAAEPTATPPAAETPAPTVAQQDTAMPVTTATVSDSSAADDMPETEDSLPQTTVVNNDNDSDDNGLTAAPTPVDQPSADDQLLAEAASSLGGTTDATAAMPTQPEAVEAVPTEPVPAPEAQVQSTPSPEASDETAAPNTDESSSANRKVIQPLSGDEAPAKPNLDELLAKEEAKEAAEQAIAQAAAQQTPSSAPEAQTETPAPTPEQKPDQPNPHDIAL